MAPSTPTAAAPDSRRRWRVAVAAALVCLVGVVAFVVWSDQRWQTQHIDEVWLTDERTVEVYAHCRDEARVEVSESNDEVTLRLQVRGENRGDCADGVVATTRSAVAERRLVDATTGLPVLRVCSQASRENCRHGRG